MKRHLYMAVAALIVVIGCDGGGESSSESGAPAEETGTDEGSDQPSAFACAQDRPEIVAGQGQLTVSVDPSFDPCTTTGYVVGSPENQLLVDPEGVLVMPAVPAGTIDIVIESSAGAALQGAAATHGLRINDVSVASGSETGLGLQALKALGSIEGVVKLSQPEGLTDHAGIDVYIPGTSYLAKTDTDGRFTISGVAPGVHNVYMEKDGYYRAIFEGVDVPEAAAATLPPAGLLLKTEGTGGLEIALGASFINNLKAEINILPTDNADLMKLSEDDNFPDASFVPLSPAVEFTFAEAGARQLYIQFADANGQNSSIFSDTVFIDLEAPNGTLTLNNGAAYTSTSTVTVSLDYSDGSSVKDMILSEDDSFAGAEWRDYEDEVTWPLSSGDGEKTLYVKTRDLFDQESDAGSESITVDTVSPSLVASSESPASGASNVDYSDSSLQIMADFSEALLGSSVAASALTASYFGTTNAAPGSASLSGTDTLLLNPDCCLEPNTRYEVAYGGFTDLAGNPVASGSWDFTTKSGWTRFSNAITSPVAVSFDPLVDSDANGNGVVVFGAQNGVYARHYLDGEGWQNPVLIEDSNVFGTSPTLYLSMGSNGDAALIWSGSDNSHVMLSRYTIATKTWSTPARINPTIPSISSNAGHGVDVADNGDICVVYRYWNTGGNDDFYVNLFDADSNGGEWLGETEVGGDSDSLAWPDIACETAQSAFVVYEGRNGSNRARAYGSRCGDTTCSAVTELNSNNANLQWGRRPKIFADGQGNAIAVFEEDIYDPMDFDCGGSGCAVEANRFTGGSWQTSANTQTLRNYGGMETVDFSGSAIGTNQFLFAIGIRDDNIQAAKFNGTTWETGELALSGSLEETRAALVNGTHWMVLADNGASWSYTLYDISDTFEAASFSTGRDIFADTPGFDTAGNITGNSELGLSSSGTRIFGAWNRGTNDTPVWFGFFR